MFPAWNEVPFFIVINGELLFDTENLLSFVPSVNIKPLSFNSVTVSSTDLMLTVVPVYTVSLISTSVSVKMVSSSLSSLHVNENLSLLEYTVSDSGALATDCLRIRFARCVSLVSVLIPSLTLL